jgi:hypothetical protein
MNIRNLARPLAASAVAGIALLGLGGTAGASTVSLSAPPIAGGFLSGDPVVTIGSGTASPAPGVDATVPSQAGSSVAVDDPTGSTGTPVTSAPLAISNGHVASADASSDVCVAVALLTGHDPAGCGEAAGAHPSLAGSLSRIGGCVRVAQASGQSADSCMTATSSGSTGDIGALGNVGQLGTVGDLGKLGTLASGGGFSSLADLAGAGVDKNAVNDAIVSNGLCSIVAQLGASSEFSCDVHAAGASTPLATAGHDGINPTDACVGLAAVSGLDPSRCALGQEIGAASADANGSAGASGHGAVSSARADNSATPSAASANGNLSGSCAARMSSSRSASPFSAQAAGGFVGLALAFAAAGRGIRRVKRARLA